MDATPNFFAARSIASRLIMGTLAAPAPTSSRAPRPSRPTPHRAPGTTPPAQTRRSPATGGGSSRLLCPSSPSGFPCNRDPPRLRECLGSRDAPSAGEGATRFPEMRAPRHQARLRTLHASKDKSGGKICQLRVGRALTELRVDVLVRPVDVLEQHEEPRAEAVGEQGDEGVFRAVGREVVRAEIEPAEPWRVM